MRVPQRYRIGQEGMGFTYQMEQFQVERLGSALSSCSRCAKAIDLTIEYTRERKAFGRSILDNQWVHYTLAELQTEVEALHAAAWRAVEMMVRGEDATTPGHHGQAQGGPAVARGGGSLPAVLGRHGLCAGKPDLAHFPGRAAHLHRRRRRRGDDADPVQVHGDVSPGEVSVQS
ncbi:acyl-CoA dehydrogenase family protein [Cupriavidus basilensis]